MITTDPRLAQEKGLKSVNGAPVFKDSTPIKPKPVLYLACNLIGLFEKVAHR